MSETKGGDVTGAKRGPNVIEKIKSFVGLGPNASIDLDEYLPPPPSEPVLTEAQLRDLASKDYVLFDPRIVIESDRLLARREGYPPSTTVEGLLKTEALKSPSIYAQAVAARIEEVLKAPPGPTEILYRFKLDPENSGGLIKQSWKEDTGDESVRSKLNTYRNSFLDMATEEKRHDKYNQARIVRTINDLFGQR